LLGGAFEGVDDLASYRAAWAKSEGSSLLPRLLDLNLRTYLLDDLLVKMDRMSMAHGLEVRSPFLDQELAAYVLQLPGTVKMRRMRLKFLLKQAFAAELPPTITRRRKQGFGVPLDRWFRTDLSQYLKSALGPGARIRNRLDPTALDAVIAAHQSGRRNFGHGLWALLTLELFLRREGW
jgi:asparagine synthase (glutamine-hydrolysing)